MLLRGRAVIPSLFVVPHAGGELQRLQIMKKIAQVGGCVKDEELQLPAKDPPLATGGSALWELDEPDFMPITRPQLHLDQLLAVGCPLHSAVVVCAC